MRLRGRVRTLPQKLIAGVLVERMTEVGAVTNELIADPEVVRAVADALAQDERTAAYVLRVDARHGIVMLRGEVPSRGRPARRDRHRLERARSCTACAIRLTIGGEALPAIALARPSRDRRRSPIPWRASEVRA